MFDATAHSISLFQESEQPKHINDIFIPKTDTGIAKPIEVQTDELGNATIQMYQLIGTINDEKAGGLDSLLNYMNENFFSKDDPAINERRYHITKKNNTTKRHITYKKKYKTKTYHIKCNRYTDEHYYNKTQAINHNTTNNIRNKKEKHKTLSLIVNMY